MKPTRALTVASIAVLVALTGACSNTKTTTMAGVSSAEKEYEAKLRALQEREAALASKETSLSARETDLASTPAPAPAAVASGDSLLPPNAKPGECYARIWIPPRFKTVTERVLAKAEGERLEIIPARYEWTTERVLVSEASSKLIPVPATYKTESERLLVENEETYWTFGTRGPASAKGAKAKMADANRLNIARGAGLPENASLGQCFAEYYTPARYGTRTERVLKSEASQKLQVIPARYENVTERVLVKEASEKVVQVPARYENQTERVLVKPATTGWKVSECSGGSCVAGGTVVNKVSGARDRIDQATGEIMCLVEIPARYKTITKRIMVSPPTTKRIPVPEQYKTVSVRKMVSGPQEKLIDIPATYQTVSKREKTADSATSWHMVGAAGAKSAGRPTGDVFCLGSRPAKYRTVSRRVVATPAASKRVEIPAQYKTVKVRKLTQPAAEKRIAIPASYQTVSRTEQTSEGHMEWQPVLCAATMTSGKVQEIQRALRAKGFYKGPIDGVVGSLTVNAMQAFQKQKGLTVSRYLTSQSVEALGVSPR